MTGNRKACQAACEKLNMEATSLFDARFDHLSLAVEEVMSKSESETPDQSEQ